MSTSTEVKGLVVNLPEFADEDRSMTLKIESVFAEQGETLTMLQKAVGGYVDCIDVLHPETQSIVSVWFNDDGKSLGLARNDFADTLATIGGWPGLSFGDYLAGPVVFTGYDPASGETTSVPEEWESLVRDVYDTASLLMAVLAGTTVNG